MCVMKDIAKADNLVVEDKFLRQLLKKFECRYGILFENCAMLKETIAFLSEKLNDAIVIHTEPVDINITSVQQVASSLGITDSRPRQSPTEEKINNIRSAFRKEHKKVLKSRRSGTSTENVCEPNIWYYKLLLFTASQEGHVWQTIRCKRCKMAALVFRRYLAQEHLVEPTQSCRDPLMDNIKLLHSGNKPSVFMRRSKEESNTLDLQRAKVQYIPFAKNIVSAEACRSNGYCYVIF
nr:unnamed protein product [Callosobruchus analis]